MASYRFPVRDETVEPAEFSGQSCQSCTAFALADCIALCCCPCCVLSFLSLALVKAPWMVGRRCLAILKKQRCFLQKRRVSNMEEKEIVATEKGLEEKCEVWGKIENYQMVGFGDESEKIWAEFYQVGQWGFGRVSFSKQTQ
ncbi:transmembrane protein [Rhynchospora pubera]|uniref:Transmembrane protein n=1 Tax=Rhynchospora pubera TaxID=906938 RepID=A0AAV8DP30_9POAL|nr:transmembrane protein [Rhynchospora pubera]